MTRFTLPVILVLVSAAVCAQTERAGLYRVQVSAVPRQAPADGKSQSRIRVEVKTQRGMAAPDGTQVVVHTDLGLLSLGSAGRQQSLTVRTSGGFAILYVTSTEPGTATVTVQVAGARSVYYVDFLPEGEAGAPDARVLDVSGGWVGYSLELGIIEARDRARLKLGKLVVECGTIVQVDVEKMTLKAQDVVVRRGDIELCGEDLFFDLAAKRGVLRRFGDEQLERVFFDAIGLRALETEWDIPSDAFRMDQREVDAWMVARSVSLFLHEKVVLRKSSLWVQEQKVFSFPPYWIIGLPGYAGATNSQALGMTSEGGLALDFPFFYRVTDRSTGALRIQHGAMAGAVASRRGWSLALSEEYRNGSGVEGAIVLSGLPHNDWGIEWRDSRGLWDDAYGYFNFSMPDHRSIFSDANIYDYGAGGRLNYRAYFDQPVDYPESYGLVADWLRDAKPLGSGGVNYRFGASAAMRRYSAEEDTLFVNELYGELDLGERSWGKKTSVSPMVTNIYTWDTGGYHENSMRAQIRLDHRVKPSFIMGLDYSAEWREGTGNNNGLSQLLGFDARANQSDKWTSYLSATYDITRDDMYGYLNFDYSLSKKWRAGLAATYFDLDQASYEDVELSVGRAFGGREVSLSYSTFTGRFSVNLGGFTLR